MTRQIERLERHVTISNEILADQHTALARRRASRRTNQGRERSEAFVEALGRRLARGRKLADEITQDIAAAQEDDARLAD